MSYQETLEKVLLDLNGERMLETVARIKKGSKTRKHNKTIINDIQHFIEDERNPLISNAIYNYVTDDWIYRSDVFSEMAFLIRMNEYEWNNKTLVLGHRAVPFMNISKINLGDVKLFTETGEEIPHSCKELELQDAAPFMILMPPYTTGDFMAFGEDGIKIDTYDLAQFIKNEGFKKGDLLEFVPRDWQKNEFIVKKKSQKDFKREGILINAKKAVLTQALEEALEEMDMGGAVLDYALFHAFAICKEEMNNYAGEPIAQIVNMWREEGFFHLDETTGATMIFLENPVDMINMEDFGDLKTFGMDDSLDGILKEVGNSYGEDFVYVNYVLQLHKNGEININAAMEILFENRNNTYFLDHQEKTLRQRMEELKVDVEKEWKTIRLSPEKQQFLKTGLMAKQKIINILRELDNRLIRPDELDMAKMQPLMEMEGMVDMLFQIVVQAKDIPGILVKQFREPFKQLLGMIDSLEKEILSDFE